MLPYKPIRFTADKMSQYGCSMNNKYSPIYYQAKRHGYWFILGTLAWILSGCGVTSNGVMSERTTTVVNGLPVALPTLQTKSGVKLPAVSWRWQSINKSSTSVHKTHSGTLPWYQASVSNNGPVVLQWHPNISPNWVNITLFRRRLRAGQPVTLQQMSVRCTVNVSYPINNGCTLGPHGTLMIYWSRHKLSSPGGLVVSALWVPRKPTTKSHGLANHQATWITTIHP